jgi:hypothetical protein
VFDLIEEPFNLIAGTVELGTEADRVVAIASRRDVCPRTLLAGKGSNTKVARPRACPEPAGERAAKGQAADAAAPTID